MSAIFKREFKSYFTTPIGFIIIAVFAFFSGMFFSVIFGSGSPRNEEIIAVMSTISLFISPFITMRLFSEDRRQKVDQVLLTAPVKVTSIVLGKFAAAFCLYALGFALTVIFQLIITFYVNVNWLIYLYALLGILLLGCVLLSIGMYISTLTESPIISAALTFGVILLINFISSYANSLNSVVFQKFAEAISFANRFNNFTTGVLDFTDIIYMVSISVFFIFLTVRSIEKRRWA